MVAEISFRHWEKPSLRLVSRADLLIACLREAASALAGSHYIQIPEQAHTAEEDTKVILVQTVIETHQASTRHKS